MAWCVIQYKNDVLFAVNILPYILTQNMAPEAWDGVEESVICLSPSRLVFLNLCETAAR